jgi:hypothetical protein
MPPSLAGHHPRRSARDDGLVRTGEPAWRDLEKPRGLSGDERRLLAELAAAVGEPLLHRQVVTAGVTAVCRCGCSSVRLPSEEPPIPEARVVELSHHDRPDHFHVAAVGRTANLADVQLVLHVARGRIHELEVFAGEGVAVPLATLTDPSEITVACGSAPGPADAGRHQPDG